MSSFSCRPGTLYVVSTPLGNLGDLTVRAGTVLREADRIYAEDTRRARILLDHLGSSVALRSLHDHNERGRRAEVVEALEAGLVIAVISDAGTPAVSDPGADLVAGVAEAGGTVSPVPGPSALAAALSVAGFVASNTSVLFLGFLPVKGKARKAALARIQGHSGVVVFYEGPHRLRKTLEEVSAGQPERPGVVARELTKLHEELIRGSVESLVGWASNQRVRGEITVVLGPLPEQEAAPLEASELDRAIRACLEGGLSSRDTSVAVAAVLGVKKRMVYQRLNELMDP